MTTPDRDWTAFGWRLIHKNNWMIFKTRADPDAYVHYRPVMKQWCWIVRGGHIQYAESEDAALNAASQALGLMNAQPIPDAPDDRALAVLIYCTDGHDGPGWYYWDDEYPEEGSCGAFDTREAAIESLTKADMVLVETEK